MRIQQGTKSFRNISFALFAGGFVTFALLYSLQPLMPEMTAAFDITPTQSSLTLSVTTVSMALTMLFIGSLSDAFGRRSIMTVSLIAASVISILSAFSPHFPILLLLRILQGVALAGLPAIAMTYLVEEIDSRSLGYAMGLYISGNSIGGMAGRMISGLLTDWFGWRAAIGGMGAVGLAAALFFFVTIPPSRHFIKQNAKLNRVIPLLWSQCRNPRLLCLYGLGFLLMGSFVTLFNYIGFELTGEPFNLSQSIAGSIFVVYLMGTFSSTWMGRLADRYGRTGVIVLALAIILTGAVLTLHSHLWVKIVGLALFAFGFFGGHSIASSWVGLVGDAHKSQANALYLFFYYVGSSVSGTGGGLLYGQLGWIGIVGMIAAYVAVSVVLCYILWYKGKMATLPS
ncbi:MFS transporter [Paenibacillus radicis (ex Gao et al. 2016)]|uniref:MFS-type transporter YybF n=1 Tax=Paenibacillus radicis (ex Gao et al. 2016) TaxID=1737354 RepID=A0A917HQ58_9BACL|nr:MFS transporter [Paenibacillus radicis (ex Gao et al. 2016)]GGG85578.1 putative MFS-type transporter YybF [Paenibacillus radicis (ex Gao et al. 2016)]